MATTSIGISRAGLRRQVNALRHANYGVEERHYATVSDALLWTLAQSAGPSFTPAARKAWKKAYDLLAGTMMEASRARVAG